MRELDVMHLGTPKVVCCFTIDDVIVDPGPEVSHHTLLEQLQGEVPRAILLTHIHFDHAGATGALVREWPEVEVWVHERGAPHLADPSKLVASATRIYGDDMQRLWGEIVPVPESNLRVLSGGERSAGWRVQYAPGHASHHVCYLHEADGIAFTGDVAGVRIDGGPIFPPTPAPDIDLDLWRESLAAVERWDPSALALTHFGLYADVAGHLAAMREQLERWGELARTVDAGEYEQRVREFLAAQAPPAALDAYLQALSPPTLWPGLNRYWTRSERVPS